MRMHRLACIVATSIIAPKHAVLHSHGVSIAESIFALLYNGLDIDSENQLMRRNST